MSWMREAGAGGEAAKAAAVASGVLADDSRELDKIRSLGMSPRQQWLSHLWSRFRTLQYESRQVEWDGAEAVSMVDRETMASASSIPPGFYASADSTPLRFRKPLAPYHLFRQIVERFSDLLFSEARHPRVTVPGDEAKEAFVQGVIDASRLWSVMAEARNYGGACGGVPIAFSFVDAKPVVEVLEPFYCFPEFKSRTTMELRRIEIRWMYSSEERNEKGKWETVHFWYRRIIDQKTDTVWDGVRIPKDKAGDPQEPDWSAPQNEPNVSEHGFGFCPVRWIQNTKVQGEPEGEYDCTGSLEMIDRMDHLLAQGLQGVDMNVDPTLMLEGVEDSEIPALKKGSYNAIKLPKGSAKYLEIAGSGPKTAMEWVQQLRAWVLEMSHCVLEDTDGAVQKTATEVVKRYASMHARAGKLREQYGQQGFLPLLEMIVKAARIKQAGRPAQPGEEGGIVRELLQLPPIIDKNEDGSTRLIQRALPEVESGCQLQAVWPAWFDPTPQDAQAATQAASGAMQGGLIDLDHAVEYVAPYYKVDDPATLVAALKKAKEDKELADRQSMMSGMLDPGMGVDPGAMDGGQEPAPGEPLAEGGEPDPGAGL